MQQQDDTGPEFVVAFRGYDRGQVDDYLEHLESELMAAEDRAAMAEERLAAVTEELARVREEVGTRASELGDRLVRMLRLADEEAHETRATAQREADELKRQAVEEIDAARARCREEIGQTLAATAEERRSAEAELDALQESKDELLASMDRLGDLLHAAAAKGRDGTALARAEQASLPPPSSDALMDASAG
jgi:DivIVA domain-containing protein